MTVGSGIRNSGSGINLFRIPDPGVKKAPDPGHESATLFSCIFFLQILLIKTLDLNPYPDPDSPEMLDQDPDQYFRLQGEFTSAQSWYVLSVSLAYPSGEEGGNSSFK
jgi:hypothetical protein